MTDWQDEPLVIITVCNRADETRRMLASYAAHTPLDRVQTVIVDNGSTDGAAGVVREFYEAHKGRYAVDVHLLDLNIGCPRALNLALEKRQPGQDVIKLDNDILFGGLDREMFETDDWPGEVRKAAKLAESMLDMPVAMVGAWYDGVLGQKNVRGAPFRVNRAGAYKVSPIVGHAVWHSGGFLDRAGYFIVLSDGKGNYPDHVYGFEDLFMAHVADFFGMAQIVWGGWQIANIQRHSAIGGNAEREAYVNKLRPLFQARVHAFLDGEAPVWTGPDGKPGMKQAGSFDKAGRKGEQA